MTMIVLVLASLVLLSLTILFFTFRKNQSRLNQKVHRRFEELINEHDYKVDTSESFNKKKIALDSMNQKLLFLDMSKKTEFFHVLDLRQLSFCHVVMPGNNNGNYISSISLECILSDKSTTMFPFYEASQDSLSDIKLLAEKASFWRKKINNHRYNHNFNNSNEYVP